MKVTVLFGVTGVPSVIANVHDFVHILENIVAASSRSGPGGVANHGVNSHP